MQYSNWTFASLIFLMVNEYHFLVLAEGRFSQRNSCIDLVAQRHFRSNSTVAVLSTGFFDLRKTALFNLTVAVQDDDLIQLLSLRTQFSLVILKPEDKNRSCSIRFSGRKAPSYFIFIGSDDLVVSCIKNFCFDRLTDDQSSFVVYLETETVGARDLVMSTLRTFWKHQHQNVVVLVAGQQEEIVIYSWFPLAETRKLKIMDRCNGVAFRNSAPVFPPKEPHNLKGKVIKIGAVIAPISTCNRIGGGVAGPEIEIINSMASALNFTAVYIASENMTRKHELAPGRWKSMEGPWVTALLETVAGDVDIAIGGYLLWPEMIDEFSYTYPFAEDFFTFYATNDLILSDFTKTLIGGIILQMTIVLSVSALALHHLGRGRDNQKGDFGASTIKVWSVMTDSTATLPNWSLKQRLLWTVCAFYAMNINTAYKSTLASFLASPNYMETIQTVTDMVDSELPFLLNTGIDIKEYPVFSSDENFRMQNRSFDCSEPLDRCLVRFTSVRQYSLGAFEGDMDFIQFVLPNQKYHLLDRRMATAYVSFYTTKNFFLTRKMSMMIHRLNQAGLMDVWYSNMLNARECDLSDENWVLLRDADANKSNSKNHSSKLPHPYSMTNLSAPFLFLGLGLVLAGIALILEVMSSTHTFRCMRSRLGQFFRVARLTLIFRSRIFHIGNK